MQSTLQALNILYERNEGIYVGPSAALNVAAAAKLAFKTENYQQGKVIVTVLCDGGER
jgi:cysteine synthase